MNPETDRMAFCSEDLLCLVYGSLLLHSECLCNQTKKLNTILFATLSKEQFKLVTLFIPIDHYYCPLKCFICIE